MRHLKNRFSPRRKESIFKSFCVWQSHPPKESFEPSGFAWALFLELFRSLKLLFDQRHFLYRSVLCRPDRVEIDAGRKTRRIEFYRIPARWLELIHQSGYFPTDGVEYFYHYVAVFRDLIRDRSCRVEWIRIILVKTILGDHARSLKRQLLHGCFTQCIYIDTLILFNWILLFFCFI